MPFADLHSVMIYYERAGSGPPLVLIPGWTLNTLFWEGVVTLLSDAFQTVCYDVRGTGRSSSEVSLEYSRVADAEDLLGLLDRLKLSEVHLAGHSKGARIAFTFAMLHPRRVLSLTAIGSAEPHGAPPGERAFRPIAQAWVGKARDVARTEGAEAAALYLARGKLFGKVRSSVEGVRRLHAAMSGYSAADLLSETPRRELEAEKLLNNLTMPIHLIAGSADPFLPECEYAHRRLPTSVLTVLPEAGHMVPFEEPALIAGLLRSSLALNSLDVQPPEGP